MKANKLYPLLSLTETSLSKTDMSNPSACPFGESPFRIFPIASAIDNILWMYLLVFIVL